MLPSRHSSARKRKQEELDEIMGSKSRRKRGRSLLSSDEEDEAGDEDELFQTRVSICSNGGTNQTEQNLAVSSVHHQDIDPARKSLVFDDTEEDDIEMQPVQQQDSAFGSASLRKGTKASRKPSGIPSSGSKKHSALFARGGVFGRGATIRGRDRTAVVIPRSEGKQVSSAKRVLNLREDEDMDLLDAHHPPMHDSGMCPPSSVGPSAMMPGGITNASAATFSSSPSLAPGSSSSTLFGTTFTCSISLSGEPQEHHEPGGHIIELTTGETVSSRLFEDDLVVPPGSNGAERESTSSMDVDEGAKPSLFSHQAAPVKSVSAREEVPPTQLPSALEGTEAYSERRDSQCKSSATTSTRMPAPLASATPANLEASPVFSSSAINAPMAMALQSTTANSEHNGSRGSTVNDREARRFCERYTVLEEVRPDLETSDGEALPLPEPVELDMLPPEGAAAAGDSSTSVNVEVAGAVDIDAVPDHTKTHGSIAAGISSSSSAALRPCGAASGVAGEHDGSGSIEDSARSRVRGGFDEESNPDVHWKLKQIDEARARRESREQRGARTIGEFSLSLTAQPRTACITRLAEPEPQDIKTAEPEPAEENKMNLPTASLKRPRSEIESGEGALTAKATSLSFGGKVAVSVLSNTDLQRVARPRVESVDASRRGQRFSCVSSRSSEIDTTNIDSDLFFSDVASLPPVNPLAKKLKHGVSIAKVSSGPRSPLRGGVGARAANSTGGNIIPPSPRKPSKGDAALLRVAGRKMKEQNMSTSSSSGQANLQMKINSSPRSGSNASRGRSTGDAASADATVAASTSSGLADFQRKMDSLLGTTTTSASQHVNKPEVVSSAGPSSTAPVVQGRSSGTGPGGVAHGGTLRSAPQHGASFQPLRKQVAQTNKLLAHQGKMEVIKAKRAAPAEALSRRTIQARLKNAISQMGSGVPLSGAGGSGMMGNKASSHPCSSHSTSSAGAARPLTGGSRVLGGGCSTKNSILRQAAEEQQRQLQHRGRTTKGSVVADYVQEQSETKNHDPHHLDSSSKIPTVKELEAASQKIADVYNASLLQATTDGPSERFKLREYRRDQLQQASGVPAPILAWLERLDQIRICGNMVFFTLNKSSAAMRS
ncbi:unnamed protein product [Amoebophrya sp. A25]|nr:unnamed protein product [Amoebophrya sp. A25]|eukprot:GSA25T00011236001.1